MRRVLVINALPTLLWSERVCLNVSGLHDFIAPSATPSKTRFFRIGRTMHLKALLISAINKKIKARGLGAHAIYALAQRIVQAYENNDVDMRSNGERWLQTQLGKRASLVAFDVGANQGEWVTGLLRHAPNCRVFCFEPVPTTFAKLQQNVRDARAQLFNMALSSEEGTLSIYSVLNDSNVSSVHDVSLFQPDAPIEKIQVSASTGDRQMANWGVFHLDILKIDAEGHDLDLLHGFKAAIDSERVDLIQFEYNVFTLLAKHSLRDFFEFLDEKYIICRLLPSGLEACGYHSSLDNFRQTNWVAVRMGTIDRATAKALNLVAARGLAGDALKAKLKNIPKIQEALLLR